MQAAPTQPANAEPRIPNADSLPAFIAQLLDPNTDFEDIAAQLTTTPGQIAYWSNLPAMQAIFESLRQLWHLRADMLAAQARPAAVATLARLVYSDNEELARRAASALLRYKPANPPGPSPHSPLSSPPLSPPSAPPRSSPPSAPSAITPSPDPVPSNQAEQESPGRCRLGEPTHQSPPIPSSHSPVSSPPLSPPSIPPRSSPPSAPSAITPPHPPPHFSRTILHSHPVPLCCPPGAWRLTDACFPIRRGGSG